MGINVAALDAALRMSLELLKRTHSQSQAFGGSGWYHRLDEPEPGPTATALGLQAFIECGVPFDPLADGLRFLSHRQVVSMEHLLDGGWATNTSLEMPVLEATATVVRFLGATRSMYVPGAPDMGRGLAWIERNQNDDGGWGSILGNTSRVWLTCLALRALAAADPFSKAVRKGVGWLVTDQADRSGWGEIAGSRPTVTHTALALVALTDLPLSMTDVDLDGAFGWLEDNLDPRSIDDKNVRIESYNVSATVDERAVTWHTSLWHHGLPIAISALLRHPRRPAGHLLEAAADTLVNAQLRHGNWPDPQGGAARTIWGVWPFVQAILDLKRLPLIRPDDQVRMSSVVVLIERPGASVKELAAVVNPRRNPIGKFFGRYWATVLLGVIIVIGTAAVMFDFVEWKDFGLSVAFPVALFVVQELRQKRRR